jgi:hypothetical protein
MIFEVDRWVCKALHFAPSWIFPLALRRENGDRSSQNRAHARFVASDHDRVLDDRRFHEHTPQLPQLRRHSLFRYCALSERSAFAAHRFNIRE